MLKTTFAMLAFIVPFSMVQAKEQTKQPQKFVSSALELKGARLGLSMSDIKGDFAISCSKDKCTDYYFPKIGGSLSVIPDKRTFAGAPITRYSFEFYEDRLVEMHVCVEPDYFQLILMALQEKYGDPQVKEKDVLQNGYGATFNNLKGTWKAKDGSTMRLERFYPNMESSCVILKDNVALNKKPATGKNPMADL